MVETNTAGSPLSAPSIAAFMAASIPNGAEPSVKNAYEAVALAVHAGFIAVGFRLIGLGEEHRIQAQADAVNPRPLPIEWNVHDSYAFRYAHSQSSMEYLVKIQKMGGKAVVFGIAIGPDRAENFDVAVKDYVSESSLPLTISSDTSADDTAKKLQDVFISTSRLADLTNLLNLKIIQKLAPGLHKPGYEETSSTRSDRTNDPPRHRDEPREGRRSPENEPEPARPYPFNDPLAVPPQPRRPLPEPIPGFEDEYEINAHPRDLRDNRSPLNIGHDDLYPPGLGPHDPLRPHFGGGIPRPGNMGGGMHPTFDDPLFRGQGGRGYDPQVPLGARYDPLGPGGGPRLGGAPGRFPGGGGGFGGPGGRPPNPFGGFGDGDFI